MAPNVEAKASVQSSSTVVLNDDGTNTLRKEERGSERSYQKQSLLIESGADNDDLDNDNKPTNEYVLVSVRLRFTLLKEL